MRPGHGDLVSGIRSSGTLDLLRARGVEHVAVSNVDNLGARLDPVVVGTHLVAGRPVTVEVAPKEGDLGGAPARVDGRLGLLEGPQFPPAFDQERIRVFNTNSATIALDALDRDFDLPWLHVRKQVDGRTAVQLERLYHQVSWELETTFLEVPRSGPRGRFFPIKEPEDLERSQHGLRELLGRPVLDTVIPRYLLVHRADALTTQPPEPNAHEAGTSSTRSRDRCRRTVGWWASLASCCRPGAPCARCRDRRSASAVTPA